MYYPILRGRQNELIAVRELQERGLLEHVTPIIEPVRASSTLVSVLERFKGDDKPIVLVDKPIVGSFEKELSQSPEYAEKLNTIIAESPQLIKMSYCMEGLPSGVTADSSRRWAFYLGPDNRKSYQGACQLREPVLTITAGGGRNHRIAKGQKVTLESAFVPQKRNADYCEHQDDFLSEELFYFAEEGANGFADYSIIGEEYSEGGFTPKVVALHLVHLNEDHNQLRVRHFTSSPTDESTNTGLKFNEALGSLLAWAAENPKLLCHTCALKQMKEIYDEERFPGLGVAKRLAIMHHLEFVNALLEDFQ